MLSSLMITVLAQAPSPLPGDDTFGWILEAMKWMVEQFQSKNYMPATGMMIMVLVFLFNMFFKEKVNKKHLALVSAGVGVLSACAMNLMSLMAGYSSKDWMNAVAMGLTMGAAASGFWSMLGKKVLEETLPSLMNKLLKKEENTPPPADPPSDSGQP